MREFDEMHRQLRIAYGLALERARKADWPVESKFAAAVGMPLNTYRRTEDGERAVTAPELDVIEKVLEIPPGTLRAEAWKIVEAGQIPSHAERAAESWRAALNPKRRP
ncbi:hypothetical protein AB0J48_20770 [Nocardia salmonicida]|uniref:hypothetical protein n=1 Tax=Nocardia salmonicida TaxID=53431 RepID=UPI0034343A3C